MTVDIGVLLLENSVDLKKPSFRRRPESSPSYRNQTAVWIPAFAGMTDNHTSTIAKTKGVPTSWTQSILHI
jgi:hypothetical protein